MTPAAKRAVAALAATLAASAIAAPEVAKWEGWENRPYRDVVSVATVCAGSTKGVIPGKTYTDAECQSLLARDLIEHGLGIAPCLPDELPVETRAAFVSAAYNIGVGAFCRSSMSRKALAGDLKGACAALSLWTKAGGKELRGLVRRRAAERQLCMKGITP